MLFVVKNSFRETKRRPKRKDFKTNKEQRARKPWHEHKRERLKGD